MNEGQPSATDETTPELRPPAPPENKLFFGPDGLRPFWGLLLFILVLCIPFAILVAIAQMANIGQPASGKQQAEFVPIPAIVMEWCQFGAVFFASWIMARIENRSVFDYGLARTGSRSKWLITGAACGVLALSLLIAILVFTGHLVITGILLGPLPAIGYGLAWAIAFIAVGFFEEFLFRGYVQFTLTRCVSGVVKWIAPGSRYAGPIGFWTAAILISFGFGLGHGSNPGESPIGLLCAGLAGLMFTFSLWRTGSLWWAIGIHAAWDWSQSFLYGVADSGRISKGHLLATHPAGAALLSGGATGPEGSIFVLPVMFFIVLIAAFTLPRTRTSFLIHSTSEETHRMPEVNSAEG